MQFEPYRQILNHLDWQEDFSDLPQQVKEWLCYTDSLTEKLQQRDRSLAVSVINEGWQQGKWHREVCLHTTTQQWIFAQTMLPKITVENVAQEVLTLGNHAIGLWLFPQIPQRQSLEWGQDIHTGLFARRSTLLLQDYPLTISELFLPDFHF